MNENTKKDTKTWMTVLMTIIILLLFIVMTTILITQRVKKQDKEPVSEDGLVFDEAAVEGGWESLSQEEVEAKLNAQMEEGMINISMNTSPWFEDSTSLGNLMIVNETINRHPQKVEIVRNDTGEVIYTSGAIPVGSKIEAAKLDVELDAGVYECTALFHNLDNSGNIIGSAGAIITITIIN